MAAYRGRRHQQWMQPNNRNDGPETYELDTNSHPNLTPGIERCNASVHPGVGQPYIHNEGIETSTSQLTDDTRARSQTTTTSRVTWTALDFQDLTREDQRRCHRLDFRFQSLRNGWLLSWCILNFIVLSTLISLPVIYTKNPSALHIRKSNVYGRNASQYVPALIGSVSVIWFRSIAQSYNRLRPYIAMSYVPKEESEPSGDQVYLTQHLDMTYSAIPDARTWAHVVRNRHWLTLFTNLIAIFGGLLVVPMKFSFIQIWDDGKGTGWDIQISSIAATVLGAVYLVYFLIGIRLLFCFWDRTTGLKWDPNSISAQVALLRESNVRTALQGTEFMTIQQLQDFVKTWPRNHGRLRLGYWIETRDDISRVVYGLHFLPRSGGTTNQGKTSIPARQRTADCSYSNDNRPIKVLAVNNESNTRSLDAWAGTPLAKHRFIGGFNLFVSDPWILFMLLITLVLAGLMTFALVKGYLDRRIKLVRLSESFNKQIGSDLISMSATSFIYSFIFRSLPSLYFGIICSTFLISDTWHRIHKPIHGMDKPAVAKNSIFLNYISPLPHEVIYSAFGNGHYRVALGSILALLGQTSPLVAGGVFVFNEEEMTVRASWPSAGYIYAMLWLNCFALLFSRLDLTYACGRGLGTILDVASFCYDSPMLQDPGFNHDPTDEEEHVKARVLLEKRNYAYGYYRGISGRRRLGFSWATTDLNDQGAQGASDVDRVKIRYRQLRFGIKFFRPPAVQGQTSGSGRQSHGVHIDAGNLFGPINQTTAAGDEQDVSTE